jgi:hypothetical protein
MSLTQVPSVMMANSGAEFYSNNYLINPSFEIWQRGTSVTNWGSFGYTADNVQIGYDGTPPSGRTLSRQTFTPGQTDIPEGDPRYYLQYDFPICGTPTNYLRFPVENVRTLAGKNAVFSFWARVPSGTMTIGVAIAQEFGTGGSPSSGVYPAATNYTVTTTWQKFTYTQAMSSLTGKTIGTNNNDMMWPAIWCPTNAAGTLQLANIKLEEGLIATPFQKRPIQVDLALCQRYYVKYNGTAATTVFGPVYVYAATAGIAYIATPQPMRSTPTLTISNLAVWNTTGSTVAVTSANTVIAATGTNSVQFNIATAGGLSAGQATMLQSNASNTGTLDLSSEL